MLFQNDRIDQVEGKRTGAFWACRAVSCEIRGRPAAGYAKHECKRNRKSNKKEPHTRYPLILQEADALTYSMANCY